MLHVGKNVRVKLEKKNCFLQFRYFVVYTLISSSTTLRYMFAQGILESHLELTSNMCLYSNFTYMSGIPFLPLS